MAGPYIGGSFAPPIDASKLDTYESLAATAPAQIKDAMRKLIVMCHEHRKHPSSRNGGTPHPVGVGTIVPLEQATIDAIDPHVPWEEETAMYCQWFDTIDPVLQKLLRDAAFHLAWFAVELEKDREPLTADKL